MKEGQVQTGSTQVIRQSDYRPPSHRITDLKLDFALGLDETWLVSEFGFEPLGHGDIQTDQAQSLVLAGDGLCFEGAWLNGEPLAADAYQVSPDRFCLMNATAGRLRLRTRLKPSANTELMGLYASRGGFTPSVSPRAFGA